MFPFESEVNNCPGIVDDTLVHVVDEEFVEKSMINSRPSSFASGFFGKIRPEAAEIVSVCDILNY